ncbi:MAG: hypothetical protein DWQ07_18175 [Chloroflexi bacterium]|nr:MAG: hypothetical protein DWQ07_18175 [Chloroflexota bacterium]MBL1197390.1 hypothetical protein [Chloroflexota bacterium]NOH14686.1 hypothetical protein [Chloroflexota bacterium]
MSNAKPSARAKRAQRLAQQRRRRQINMVLIAIGAIAIVGALVWINRPQPLGEVVLPQSIALPPDADGLAWGPQDAPVLIEEYSDFQ